MHGVGRIGRVIALKLDVGEDLLKRVIEACKEYQVRVGVVSAIGALRKVRVGIYSGEGKYKVIKREGIYELAACIGNVVPGENGKLIAHLHFVVSNGEEVLAGHVLDGNEVGVTAEVFILEVLDLEVIRKLDVEKKLKLWVFA